MLIAWRGETMDDRREPFGRVKIVLAALVDDPKVALSRRVLIRDGSIDLV